LIPHKLSFPIFLFLLRWSHGTQGNPTRAPATQHNTRIHRRYSHAKKASGFGYQHDGREDIELYLERQGEKLTELMLPVRPNP
jgi:hypothetical protein